MRDYVAAAASRFARKLTRSLGTGGGTALPGLIALKLSPGILARLLDSIPGGFVFVSGTNGKTTTCALLDAILGAAGFDVIRNSTGSNLARGLASCLLERTDGLGRLTATDQTVGVFEVDEAALISLLPGLRPRMLVLTNLFRDQLDRYGEIDALSQGWARIIGAAGDLLLLVANADDPSVMRAASACKGRLTTFGVSGPSRGTSPDEWADAASCPVCSNSLVYRFVSYSHLGDYLCPRCGFARPAPDVEARDVEASGLDPASFSLRIGSATTPVAGLLPGLFNVYNAAAAAAAAAAWGIAPETIRKGLEAAGPAFGRAEETVIDGTRVVLLLIKNPAGANEIFRSLRQSPREADLLLVLNDAAADGEDVSWIWDVDVEGLKAGRIVVSGRRAADLALRLKYGGVEGDESTAVEGDLDAALALSIGGPSDTLHVLATYTAMLELRGRLVRRGVLQAYWNK